MNKKQRTKQMRRFINKYGEIKTEYKRPKDVYYRKGSYFVHFSSKKLGLVMSVGDINKYQAYKSIVKYIKEILNEINSEII